MAFGRWFRRAPKRLVSEDAGPVLVGDVWMDARGHSSSDWRATARATWGRRLGLAARGFRSVGAWLVGVEARSGVEQRSITSVPWSHGGGGTRGGARGGGGGARAGAGGAGRRGPGADNS